MAQRISSSQWCLRSQDRSYPVLAFYVFSCSISPENSGSVKNRRCKTCIYPALIREIFSRRGPLSSGVIMCMYGNFTVRLVTVQSLTRDIKRTGVGRGRSRCWSSPVSCAPTEFSHGSDPSYMPATPVISDGSPFSGENTPVGAPEPKMSPPRQQRSLGGGVGGVWLGSPTWSLHMPN